MMKLRMIRRALGSATRQLHESASKEPIKPSNPAYIFSREIIKPSSPTPPNLKTHRLSSLDQFTTRTYIPLVLYYPAKHGRDNSPSMTAEKLKSSLTQTLNQYYPFAGRFSGGGVSVDCNDEGIEFVETRINCGLSEILENPDHEAKDHVTPPGSIWGDPYENSNRPVMVQLNHFDCGGILLSVTMSHKIGDGITLANFLTHWAAVARGSGEQVAPYFVGTATSGDDFAPVTELDITPMAGGITKRFMFPNSKIAQLKAMVTAEGLQNPSRVQLMTALLSKSVMAAAAEVSGSFAPGMIFQFLNMRPKMAPPLPPTSAGNIYKHFPTFVGDESEMKVSVIAEQINKDKLKIKGGVDKLDGNDCWGLVSDCLSKNAELYMCSSMCRFPFAELDFGWGKPAKATLHDLNTKNLTVLMDTASGDGIEAIVNLDQQRMAALERDKDLLAFAS